MPTLSAVPEHTSSSKPSQRFRTNLKAVSDPQADPQNRHVESHGDHHDGWQRDGERPHLDELRKSRRMKLRGRTF